MADRSISVTIGANVRGLVAGLRTAQSAVTRFGKETNKWVTENRDDIDSLSTTLGLMGAAAVAGAGLAVKAFADFDKAMSGVEATGEATASQLEQLRDAAMDAGQATAFSATEAALGIEELLKAGVSAEDVLGGGLSGALDLAAAGQLDVASASEIAATALTQFNLAGEDVPHVADLLAAGAGKAQGDVDDLAQALNQAGLVAAQTGLTIEETTGSLAAFASAGLLGSDAGTSFKTMLQRLSAPTGEAASLMEELGINAYDASGQFVGMTEFAGQLRDALDEMTPAQRNAALATIFGSDAVRAAAVIYDQGEEGIRNWISAVDDQGYAAEVAATRLDNLAGDLTKLRGALETALIGMGEGANGPLRSLVQSVTDVVNAFSDLPAGVQQATLAIVGGGGLVALGVAGLGKLLVGISDARAAMSNLGISAKTAGIAAGALGAAVGVAAIGFAKWAQNAAEARAEVEAWKSTFDEFGGATDETLSRINESLSQTREVWYQFGEDQRSAIQIADQYGVAITDVQQAILGNDEALQRVNSALETAHDRYALGTEGAYLFREGSRRLLGTISEQREGIAKATTETQRKAAADKAAGISQDGLTAATKPATSAIEQQVTALAEQQEKLDKAARSALGVSGAQIGLEQAIDDATKAVKDNGKGLDINTQKGRDNRRALDAIAAAGLDVAESMREQGSSEKDLRRSMSRTRESFIRTAIRMGATKREARDLADEYGLIPSRVETDVEAEGVGRYKAKMDEARSAVYSIPESRTTYLTQVVRQVGSTLSGIFGGATGGLVGFASGGLVPGTPPADPMQDNVFARTQHGTPYLIRSGEFIQSEPAVDYYGADAMAAINARRIPKDYLRGFAEGGRVPGPGATTSMAGPSSPRVVQYITQNYPQAEPASVGTNRALQYAAEPGV